MDIFQILHRDHQEVLGLLDDAEKLDQDEESMREDIALQIKQALLPHAKAEQKTFYERLKTSEEGKSLVEEGVQEHRQAEELVKKLAAVDAMSTEWLKTVQSLKQALIHHISEEESEIFKVARQQMSGTELTEIVDQFEEEKMLIKESLTD